MCYTSINIEMMENILMKREILLERIEKLKAIMPWYVLEYYQSKLTVPYSFTTLYEYLKEYDRFFIGF